MDKEFERIQKNIKEYERERDAIRDMIEEYEKYIRLINQNIEDASDDKDSSKNESKDLGYDPNKDYAAEVMKELDNGKEFNSKEV